MRQLKSKRDQPTAKQSTAFTIRTVLLSTCHSTGGPSDDYEIYAAARGAALPLSPERPKALGRAVALQLASEGAAVVLADSQEDQLLKVDK